MMKSCAVSAAFSDVLNYCGLSLVMQTMHKEEMKIKERNLYFDLLYFPQ